MKRIIALFLSCTMLLAFAGCASNEPYAGDPIAPAADSDTQAWPTGTFFDSAPHVAATVKSVTANEDQSSYSIKISQISYEDFVKWAQAMKDAGVKPVGSGEYGLDGAPIDGLASFNGETRKYTVISTWTQDGSSARTSDHALSISFIKK